MFGGGLFGDFFGGEGRAEVEFEKATIFQWK
jgi:hypothetical protein